MNPLNPGDVIGRAFTIYRDNAGALVAAAFIVFAVTAIADLVFDEGSLMIIASAIGLIASVFYQGMVVRLVDDVRDGVRDASLDTLFKSVAPVALPLFLLSIVVTIGLFFGFLFLIVPGLFLMTIWAVAAPVVVIERKGVFEALGRSQELVKGNAWNVFGVIVLMFVLLVVVVIVGGTIGAIGGDVVSALVRLVATVFVAPLVALAAAVLYFTLRDVKEGVR